MTFRYREGFINEEDRQNPESNHHQNKVKRRVRSLSPQYQDTTASVHTQLFKQPIVPSIQESKTIVKRKKNHHQNKHFPSRKEIREQLLQLKRKLLRKTDPELEYEIIGKICKVSNVRNFPNSQQYQVVAARRKKTREIVAVKILPVKGFFERTLEGQIYTRSVLKAQYPSLPHIVKTEQIFVYNDKIYLVMEYLPLALNKFERLFQAQFNSLLPEVIVAKAIRDVLIGLNTLHTFGFVHCDIKPGNVLVSLELEFKLTDFGQCYRMSKGLLDNLHGTDGYASFDREYNTTEDIYSVGRLTLYLLVGAERWFDYYKTHTDLRSFLKMEGISKQAKEFVQLCVAQQRPSAKELLLKNDFIQVAERKGLDYRTLAQKVKEVMIAIQRF